MGVLSEVCKKSEIEALRSRITDHKSDIILHICDVARENINDIYGQLRKWEEVQSSRHDELLQAHTKLDRRLQLLTRSPNLAVQDLDGVCGALSDLSLNTRQYAKEGAILKSLSYKELPLRHDIIPKAHKVTLNWAFDGYADVSPETSERSNAFGNLSRWLSGPNGLFWISGKPGSGKSTLMKFVADNERTKHLLGKWSGDQPLIITAYYFTIYGTPIQRSLEGLLRSLLYKILQ
ncbi:hypothetical protein B0T21DRAFT_367469 [Apiosordaria backusii]|uniref:Nephrocystin 3-like N-terminal domain-containing protein n=1 Tax=Apiosordaria backusii TaxID=314023 RepID=A0AA40ECW5_9PEZI|nr:hypothetical protein B0T21DRAFT_367469 [Apiosordaria backusii]